MSGPPPCTTIGFMPTYLSSTTSRAKSSVRSGSVMAAPPYLMTIVLPWNSRMYGRASRRVRTSRISRRSAVGGRRGLGASARVLRVECDVLFREVAEEDLRLAALSGDGQLVLHLRRAHGPLERLPVG